MELSKVLTDTEKKTVEIAVNKYVEKVLFDANASTAFEIPQGNKLAFVQVTRPAWKKTRVIGKKKNEETQQWEDEYCDYIPIRKMERLLNFLFNFQWESELISKDFEVITKDKVDYKTKKVSGTTTTYEAVVVMKFTCNFFGQKQIKTVSGSWKMYENNAISQFAVIQAAISQAIKNFGKQYGIGADLNDDIEDRFAEKLEAPTIEVTEEKMAGLINDFDTQANN